jgi:acetylornithine deacetylase/succinyl-diaminopimelate desuccinylase-like protein
MNTSAIAETVARTWDSSIVPQLVDYIRIPAKSPHFDPQWQEHGHIERVIRLAEAWVRQQPVRGMTVDIVRLPGRTPVLFFDVAGSGGSTVLLYGHLDKQPEMVGWRDGLGPWQPVLADGKLYGRGGADDGYAVFASLAAIAALQAHGIAHSRCVGVIETCEESGSYDLPPYLDLLAPRMGAVDFVVGLDSGCGDYERLWATTSLRGLVGGTLLIEVLTEGVHSGDASGVVPSSFRIARAVLDRIEDSATGRVLPAVFHTPIPEERARQAHEAAAIMGETRCGSIPSPMPRSRWSTATRKRCSTGRGARAFGDRRGWPSADCRCRQRAAPAHRTQAFPAPAAARRRRRGAASAAQLLEADPPHGASVRFESDEGATGWNAPPTAPWLVKALGEASQAYYGKPAAAMGEGGTIPFMAMLGKHFPQAQFLITGVLGPKSNAHGPNEFLHVPYATKLTACVASVLAVHAARSG